MGKHHFILTSVSLFFFVSLIGLLESSAALAGGSTIVPFSGVSIAGQTNAVRRLSAPQHRSALQAITTAQMREFSSIADAFVASGQPNDPHNTRGLYVGRAAGGPSAVRDYGDTRSLLRFDLTSLRFVDITGVTLRLWLAYTCCAPDGLLPVEVQRINSPWEEAFVNWNNKPSMTSISATPQSVPVQPNTFVEWILPEALVQGWVDDPTQNYGLSLVSPQGEQSGKIRAFFSQNYPDDPDLRPQLIVAYEEIPDPALEITARVQPTGIVQFGDHLTYTIAYTNQSADRKISATITGSIPSGAAYLPGSSNSGDPQDGRIVKSQTDLGVGLMTYAVQVVSAPITLPVALAVGGQVRIVQGQQPDLATGPAYTCPVTITLTSHASTPVTRTVAVTTGVWASEWMTPATDAPAAYTVQARLSPEQEDKWHWLTPNPLTITLPLTAPQNIAVSLALTPAAGVDPAVCLGQPPPADRTIRVRLGMDCAGGEPLLDPASVELAYGDGISATVMMMPVISGFGAIGDVAPGVYTVTLHQPPTGWRLVSAATRTVAVQPSPAQPPVVDFLIAPITISNTVIASYTYEASPGPVTKKPGPYYLWNGPVCSRLYLPVAAKPGT